MPEQLWASTCIQDLSHSSTAVAHSIARVRGAERGRLEGDRRVLQVSDVLRAIEDQFSIAFPRRVWVFGTVRGLRGNGLDGDGELELLLTEASAEIDEDPHPLTLPSELDAAAYGDIDASLRRLHDVAVEDLLVEGHLVRAGGLLSYDVRRHTIVFSITALDPQPTSTWLEDRRQAVRQAADEARLAERQRDVQVPLAPRDIGLVGISSDGAVDEVRRILGGGGFDVDVTEYRVQETGQRTAEGLANALRNAGRGGHDAVLLVRSYGRPLALAPYDAEVVIRAVAISPVPVISGLGAPEAPAAVESVAHQAYPTAPEAAEAILRKLQRASELIDGALELVVEAGDEALRRGALRVEQMRSEVAEDLRQARTRAEAARKKRMFRMRALAAVLALVIVLVAVLTGVYVVLAALVVPLGLGLFSERLRPQRRRGPVSVTDLSFSAALQRLGDIRHDLQDVADPDVVDALEQEANSLAEHCRALLRRPRSARAQQRPVMLEDEAQQQRASESEPGPESEDHLFDQFASPSAAADRDDAATVSIPTSQADAPLAEGSDAPTEQVGADGPNERKEDAPTEALNGTQRTITLPGDAPTTPPASEDEAPTTGLHRRS